jgi:aryl-alcohol dehydrogenase-like predicted oxidoreductase
MFDAVSCAIPGAKTPAQAEENVRAAELPPLTAEAMRTVQEVYDRLIRPQVHQHC